MHKWTIFSVLEKLPDFSIDLHFKCGSSFIPFVSNIAPSDTYKIFKKGSSLRLDMTLLGFKKLKSIRGNISVIYKGRNSGECEGQMLVVDHDKNKVSQFFEGNSKVSADVETIMAD